jgi:hypothetical protein
MNFLFAGGAGSVGRDLTSSLLWGGTGAGQPLMVPDGAGGSFLDHDDLTHALLLAMQEQESVWQIFNLATIYLK